LESALKMVSRRCYVSFNNVDEADVAT
jgi:hypothetical protein